MFTAALPLMLKDSQQVALRRLAESGKTPQKTVLRARMVLAAGEGLSNCAIAKRLGVSRPTVILWRQRFEAGGVEGILQDAPRPGRPKALGPDVEARVVEATLHATPPGATHGSVRSMAQAQGLSRMAVQRIWKKHRL